MATPTFNGVAFWGPCPVMTHDDPANAAQVNHYPGTLGVERLDLGPADTYTHVHGVLVGDTPEDLGNACNLIRQQKNDGTAAELVDTDGASWPNSVIESFRTSGRSVYAPGLGWTRDYECKILHLGIDPSGDGEPTTP